MFGKADGRSEQIDKRQRAMKFPERDPSRNTARYGHGVPAGSWDAISTEPIDIKHGRSAARGVDAVEPLSVPRHGKGVCAEAVGGRFHDGERCGGGDGSIRCSATACEDVEADLRGKGLSGRDNLPGQHRHAGAGQGGRGERVRPAIRHEARSTRSIHPPHSTRSSS